MSFDPESYAMGKAAGGGGGGSDVPLLTRTAWNALSTAQKQAYGLVAIQDEDSGFSRGYLYNGADYNGDPALVKAVYMNGSQASSSPIQHIIENDGVYTIVVALLKDKLLSGVSVTLNGNDITGDLIQRVQSSDGKLKIYALQDTFSVGDTISVSNITFTQSSGVQLFVFKNVDIISINLVGVAENTEATFSIPASDSAWYFEVAKYGYYEKYNTIPETRLFQAPSGDTSTPCPANVQLYWYGGTYVITVQ